MIRNREARHSTVLKRFPYSSDHGHPEYRTFTFQRGRATTFTALQTTSSWALSSVNIIRKKKKKNRCQATCKYGWRFTLVPRRHASKKNLLLPADTACRRCTHFPGHIKDCMSNLCFTTAWVDYQFIFEDPMWARLVQHAFSCSWAIVFFINHRWASQALELVNHWMNDNGRNSSKAKLFWSRSAKVRVDSCIW